MDRLIICGSPRAYGRSAKLAKDLFEACIAEAPDDELALVPVSQVNIAGCQGCGLCGVLARGLDQDKDDLTFDLEYDESEFGDEDDGTEQILTFTTVNSAGEEVPRRCSIDDDMTDVYELIDHADELYLVTPVYFAGVPSQLKALLDRLQPYYMATAQERAQAAAEGRPFRTAVRPAILHVVGEGADPHGIDALVTTVKSAIACAGFKLETVFDWVGRVSAEGEIVGEPRILDLLTGATVVPGQEQHEPLGEPSIQSAEDQDGEQVNPGQDDFPNQDDWDDFDASDADDAPVAQSRPQLHFHDEQLEERGRKSAEAGKRGRSNGRGEKRTTKGGNQTNNRNPRKENAKKRRSSDSGSGKKNTGRPANPGRSGARANGGKGAGSGSAKGGKKRG